MGKILIVHDDKHILDLLSLELSELGYEVIREGSCSGLLINIEIHQPDVIILDIKPNDRHGLNMLQKIMEYDPNLPVIVWSSYESYMYDTRRIDYDYFVTKSCDLTELKLKIECVLDKKPISPKWLPREVSLFGLRSDIGWKSTVMSFVPEVRRML
jgi:DNA-binding NtrC family response regulator